MNEVGQALLVNAICYIARFTDDRPIVRTPFWSKRNFGRRALERLVANPDRDLKLYLPFYVGKAAQPVLEGKSREELGNWYRQVRDYLHADEEGKLAIDTDLQALKVAAYRPEFFERMFALLNDAAHGATARQLLQRYVQDGPPAAASAEQWKTWWKENRPYLFFTDTGGYRWQVDPLAKRRGIPTEKLRGPSRATLAAVEARANR